MPQGRLLKHPSKRGIGARHQDRHRERRRNPWVTFMPADGQIPPLKASACYAPPRLPTSVPLVLSVYEARDDGGLRKILSWGVRMMIRTIHGVTLRCEGPYLFRRDMFDPEVLTPDSFFLNFEFPIRVLRDGHPVSVVEIPCRPRIGGHSKTANVSTILSVASDLVSLRFRLRSEPPGKGS